MFSCTNEPKTKSESQSHSSNSPKFAVAYEMVYASSRNALSLSNPTQDTRLSALSSSFGRSRRCSNIKSVRCVNDKSRHDGAWFRGDGRPGTLPGRHLGIRSDNPSHWQAIGLIVVKAVRDVPILLEQRARPKKELAKVLANPEPPWHKIKEN